MMWMRLFALGALFHGMMADLAGAAAVIMPGGISRTFEKTGSTWIDILGDLPGPALSVSIKSGTTPMLAIGYSGRIELL